MALGTDNLILVGIHARDISLHKVDLRFKLKLVLPLKLKQHREGVDSQQATLQAKWLRIGDPYGSMVLVSHHRLEHISRGNSNPQCSHWRRLHLLI